MIHFIGILKWSNNLYVFALQLSVDVLLFHLYTLRTDFSQSFKGGCLDTSTWRQGTWDLELNVFWQCLNIFLHRVGLEHYRGKNNEWQNGAINRKLRIGFLTKMKYYITEILQISFYCYKWNPFRIHPHFQNLPQKSTTGRILFIRTYSQWSIVAVLWTYIFPRCFVVYVLTPLTNTSIKAIKSCPISVCSSFEARQRQEPHLQEDHQSIKLGDSKK